MNILQTPSLSLARNHQNLIHSNHPIPPILILWFNKEAQQQVVSIRSIQKKKLKATASAAQLQKSIEDQKEEEEDNLDLAPSDFFECYLSHEMVTKIQKCWTILETLHEDLHDQFVLTRNTLSSPSFMTAGSFQEDQGMGTGIGMESSFFMEEEASDHKRAKRDTLHDSFPREQSVR
jgi:hypothetical protein